MSAERLRVTAIPGAGWRASDIRDVAKAAEEAGFEAVFTTGVNNDAIATAQVMGNATARIRVGTWVANIYLQHSYTCAKGASLIADDTGGPFILGLGVSHQPVNDALAIDMTSAPADLSRYVLEVRDWLEGKGPTTHSGGHRQTHTMVWPRSGVLPRWESAPRPGFGTKRPTTSDRPEWFTVAGSKLSD